MRGFLLVISAGPRQRLDPSGVSICTSKKIRKNRHERSSPPQNGLSMTSLGAGLTDPLPRPEIARPLARAEDALARLDERLTKSPIRDGWIARTHFADAAAALWLKGQLVHLEDLVLHDAGTSVRPPMNSPNPTRSCARAAASPTPNSVGRCRPQDSLSCADAMLEKRIFQERRGGKGTSTSGMTKPTKGRI
jgi:hypothetical protein